MTYRDLMCKAFRLLDSGKITVGEYEKMTEPLDREVEEMRGGWIEDGYQGYPCVCSVCGIAQDIKAKFLFSFCPSCGAYMRKGGTNEAEKGI